MGSRFFNCDHAIDTSSFDPQSHSFGNRIEAPYTQQFTQRVDIQSSISVEYITCDDTSTCLINALQYTALLQLVSVIVFFIFYSIFENGLSVLIKPNTYTNALLNKKHGEQKPSVVESSVELMETEIQPIDVDRGTLENADNQKRTSAKLADQLAQLLLKAVAPKCRYVLHATTSWIFILWYLVATFGLMAVLLWYFIDGGCSSIVTTIPKNLGSDQYLASFASNGNHLCSSKGSLWLTDILTGRYTFKGDATFHVSCLLSGLTCEAYGGIGTSQCSNSDGFCSNTSSLQTCSDLPLAFVEVEYTKCISLPVAIMSAIQYTFFAEFIVLGLFFLVIQVLEKGVGILLDSNTYYNLWNNVSYTEGDSNEEKQKIETEDVEISANDPDIQSDQNDEMENELGMPKMTAVFSLSEIPPKTANALFATVSLRSKIRITGFFFSSIFILWFISSSGVMFGALFWYFYTHSCNHMNAVIDNRQDASVYKKLFSTGNNYFCTAKLSTTYDNYLKNGFFLECLLHGFTPDDYVQHFLCPKSNLKKAMKYADKGTFYYATDYSGYVINDPAAWVDGTLDPYGMPWKYQGFIPYWTNAGSGSCYSSIGIQAYQYGPNGGYPSDVGPVSSIEYVSCDPISSTLATAGQFTLYAQTLIIGIFLILRRVKLFGISALFEKNTYTELWENVEATL